MTFAAASILFVLSIVSLLHATSTSPLASAAVSGIETGVEVGHKSGAEGNSNERVRRGSDQLDAPCPICAHDCKQLTGRAKKRLKLLPGFLPIWRQPDTTVCRSPSVTATMTKARSIALPGMPGKTVGHMVDAFLDNGCPAVVKGGSIRDAIMGKQLTDGLDFVSLCSKDRLNEICTAVLGGDETACREGFHDENLPVFIIGSNEGKLSHHFLVDESFYDGAAYKLEYTTNSLAYDFQNKVIIDVTGANAYEDACRHRIGIPGPSSPDAWDKWSNPNKLFRFWKLRYKKCAVSTKAVDDFVASKAGEYWKDQAYDPNLLKLTKAYSLSAPQFSTENAPFFWLYCQKVLGGRHKNAEVPCDKCAPGYKAAAASWDQHLAADLKDLWSKHLAAQAEAMLKSCGGN